MNIWIITDTHFNHGKMIEYCGRPVNFENEIRRNICLNVTKYDILIHLGDVCIGNDSENNNWFKDKGKKRILVLGNHDNKSFSWYLNNGWDFVCKTFNLEIFGKNILFSHQPQKVNDYDLNIHGHFHNALPRLLKREWKVDGEKERNEQDLLNLLEGKHELIALEYTNYKPVNLKKIIELNGQRNKTA